jgi:hypothetical protein
MQPNNPLSIAPDGAIKRANHLILEFLKVGPRSAREILAAAEGAKISVRTIQRAATSLGVVKTKATFSAGWTWRLPADEGATTDAPAEQPGSCVLKDVEVQPREEPARAEVIAARLRKLEAGRGKKAPIYAQDRRVIRWVEAGISDPGLREAYEAAVFAMEGKQDQAMLTVGFLDRFVWDAMKEAA